MKRLPATPALALAFIITIIVVGCQKPAMQSSEDGQASVPGEAGDTVAPREADAAIKMLKPGMLKADVHAQVMPLAGEYVDNRLSGNLLYRTYAFPDRSAIMLRFIKPWDGSVLDEIQGPFTRYPRWYGRFEPSAQEVKQAAAIAAAHLQSRLDAGDDAFAAHPTDPAGRPVWKGQHRVPLQLKRKDGTEIELLASGSGEHVGHRLVHLDLTAADIWQNRVTVDMTDRVVVPTQWVPDEAIVAKLLPVAKQAQHIPADARLEQAWGDYDYGPTRRLITYYFEWNSGSIGYVTVDADQGVLFVRDDGWEVVD